MSNKTKNSIVYSVMTMVVALFIYAVFVGKQTSDQEQKAEDEKEPNLLTQNEQEHQVRDYDSNEEQLQEQEGEDESIIQEQHGDLDIEIPDADTLEKPESFYGEHFSTEAVEESQQVAESFTKNYYAFNGDEIKKHVESAKPYMTNELYQALRKEEPRPTAAVYNKEVETLDVYEPYEPSKEQLTWKVRVQGKVYDSNEEQTAEESKDYTLKMQKIEGTFKVEDFMLNVPY